MGNPMENAANVPSSYLSARKATPSAVSENAEVDAMLADIDRRIAHEQEQMDELLRQLTQSQH